MKYNFLALSIMTLGLVGCANQPISSQNTPLNQKIYHSYEQLVSKQSYAFDGKMTFNVDTLEKKDQVAITKPAEPSKREQALQQFLLAQPNIQAEQQQWMKDGLVEDKTYGAEGRAEKVDKFLQAFLSRYYYAFDGVVDLKQGQISFNPTIGYTAKNAQGWFTVPLALDLRQSKAYADISAISPVLTDPQYDGRYVVFDFQDLLKKANVDIKPALEILREFTLVNAALAKESDYTTLSLTDDDRKRGGATRVRYQGNYNELIAQYVLYFYLNSDYIKGIFTDKATGETLEGLNPIDLALSPEAQYKHFEALAANSQIKEKDRAAMYRLLEAIDAIYAAAYEAEEVYTAADAAVDAADLEKLQENYKKEMDACNTQNSTAAKDACLAATDAAHAAQVSAGYASASAVDDEEYVSEYEQQSKQRTEALAKFDSYKSDKLISAQAMQKIVAEQPEAYQHLIENTAEQFKEVSFILGNGTYQSDLILDAKGRLIRSEMNVKMNGMEALGISAFNSKVEMNIHNYGKAKVDTSKLNNAIPLEQASNENSIVNLNELLQEYTGKPEASDDKAEESKSKSWYKAERYDNLAQSLLKQNMSFVDAYATLYRYAYIIEGDDLEYGEEFDVAALNDTARWAAYYYAIENNLPVTTKQKAEYENSPDEWYYYDDYIASGVWRAISEQLEQQQQQQQFDKLKKQGKTNAQIFSAIYLAIETEAEKKYSGEKTVKFDKEFIKLINVLGEVAAEDLQTQKINTEKLKKFDSHQLDRISSDTYRQVYKLFVQ